MTAGNGDNGDPRGDDRYQANELVWARSDEGSIGQAYIVDDDLGSGLIYVQWADAVEAHQKATAAAKAISGPPPDRLPTLVLNRIQVAWTRDALTRREPPLEDAELQELIEEVANSFGLETVKLLATYRTYAETRWGEGSLRAMVGTVAAIGAMKGAAEGHLVGVPVRLFDIAAAVAGAIARSIGTEHPRKDHHDN